MGGIRHEQSLVTLDLTHRNKRPSAAGAIEDCDSALAQWLVPKLIQAAEKQLMPPILLSSSSATEPSWQQGQAVIFGRLWSADVCYGLPAMVSVGPAAGLTGSVGGSGCPARGGCPRMGSAPCPAPSLHSGPEPHLWRESRGQHQPGVGVGTGTSRQGTRTYNLLHHLIHGLLFFFQLSPSVLQEDQQPP